MKELDFYERHDLYSEKEVFSYFIESILPANKTWEFYINWKKVFHNIDENKIELNILNTLCGSKKFDDELRHILSEYPEVIKVFPTLLAVREQEINILDDDNLPEFNFKTFKFNSSELTDSSIDDYVLFFKKSGLKKLVIDGTLSSLKDYAFGVEVGLDTNGRKNRGGAIMERLVEDLLQNVYDLDDSTYITQGSPSAVKQKWSIDLPVDKTSRRPDFLVNKKNRLFWIETNFYSGGGSKLKSTCGEYKALFDFCRDNDVEFIWITDGEGWKSTLKPLEETFLHNDFIFNLSMVKEGILKEIWD